MYDATKRWPSEISNESYLVCYKSCVPEHHKKSYMHCSGSIVSICKTLRKLILYNILYSRLISRGKIFVDWTVKTFRRYIFEDYTSKAPFH